MTPPPDTFMTRRTFPGGREVIDIGKQYRANIAVDRDPSALELRIRFADVPMPSSSCREITLRVCAQSSSVMEIAGVPSPTWHMAAGLFPAKSGDVFSTMMSITYDLIVRCASLPYESQLDMRLVYEGQIRHAESCRTEYSNSVVSSMRIVAAALRHSAIHATRLCDPALLRVVRRFSPCMRLWLYRALAGDSSGRLAQLATSCPGVLVFGFALQEHDATRTVGSRLLDGAIEGRRLNHLLTEAVSNWSSAATDWITQREPRLARPWLRILNAGSEERRHLEAEQRLLIRRAGPRTSPTHVLLPPPLAFTPEDIPSSVYENTRWFRTLKSRADLISPHADQNETLLRELAQFASHHSRVLAPPRSKARIGRRMGQMIDYVLAVGRHTSRNTCPTRLLAECRQWHRTVDENLEIGNIRGAGGATLETEFPVLVADSWSDDRVVVAQIRTVGELIKEGKRMRHCVGTRTEAALKGRCSIYSVEVEGKPLTVELTHLAHGRAFVSEIVGFANRKVGEKEIAAIQPWLAKIGALS